MGTNPWNTQDVLDALSREPFGEAFAERLWDAMQALKKTAEHSAYGTGILYQHRDYCGIGLCWQLGQFGIFSVYDGGAADLLVSWEGREDFVRYWAAQSDFGLCGADPLHPELLADEAWLVNNQRLERERIEEFLQQSAEQEASSTPKT
jgi:hypothetical protein